jgi:hypothetical protein
MSTVGEERSQCPQLDRGDPIQGTERQVLDLREEAAATRVKELVESTRRDLFELGGVLSLIREREWFRGQRLGEHTSFKDWAEAEGLRPRKALYLASAFDRLVKSGASRGTLEDVGWAKLWELAPVLTPDNLEEWVGKTHGVTFEQLTEEVKRARRDARDGRDSRRANRKERLFRLYPDQHRALELALEQIKEELRIQDDNTALEWICQSYLACGMVVRRDPLELPDAPACRGALREVLQVLKQLSSSDHNAWVPLVEAFTEVFPEADIDVRGSDGPEPDA